MELITRAKDELTTDQWRDYENAIDQRRNSMPVAYLTGRREFWSMNLLVNTDVLIPRPETEVLVELVLGKIDKNTEALVADLGTGSGAIALAIASERPRALVIATDVSQAALDVARKNALRLGVENIEFCLGQWPSAFDKNELDLIATNPPYVRTDDPHLRQGDVRFEPREALVGGDDGLDVIRDIAQKAPYYLKHGGYLLVEHGSGQGRDVQNIVKSHGLDPSCIYNDLAGLPRVCVAQKP